jgi:hypothetical protein
MGVLYFFLFFIFPYFRILYFLQLNVERGFFRVSINVVTII